MYRAFSQIFLVCVAIFSSLLPWVIHAQINDLDLNLRNTTSIGVIPENSILSEFINSVDRTVYIMPSGSTGEESLWQILFLIAREIKNIAIWIAIILLLISVIQLIFRGTKDDMKRWGNGVIYTSIGIIFLQSVFAIWSVFLFDTAETVDSGLAWKIVVNVVYPIIWLLQLFAVFGFVAMGIYSFYVIVKSGYDDGARTNGIRTFIYAVIWFLLIRIPEPLVRAIYGNPECSSAGPLGIGLVSNCAIWNANLNDAIGIVGSIINFLNGFLALVCVILIIWAGWLIFSSRGEGDGLKKARSIIIYIILGLLLLVSSHLIFRFLILEG